MSKLPIQLLENLEGLKGFDKETFVKVHQSGDQVTSIRLNPKKQPKAVIDNEEPFAVQSKEAANADTDSLSLQDVNESSRDHSTQVPWCSFGRYLPTRPSFTFDPTFHAGAYYVQEASSMFIDHIITQLFSRSHPSKVLDLCGAPGGKSTLLAGRLTESFIISNEVIKSRVTVLAENLTKWGSSNVLVTHNDPKDFEKLPSYFDLMVVDAPCSGSGLFRKDVSAIEEWSEVNVNLCSQRQQRILQHAIVSLKTNGYLIYSTCSYSKQEDEDICDWIIDNLKLEPINISIDPAWGIVETFSDKHNAAGYRFYPDKLKGEGFFVACFKQNNDVDEYSDFYPSPSTINKNEREIISKYVNNLEELTLIKQKETIIALPAKYGEALATIQKTLNVRKSGVAIGTIKGKDLVPHHELALASFVSSDVPVINLNYNSAIKYLQRQDFSIDSEVKGWAIMRYNNINLGWAKILPNRINNYYPTDWRILKH